jgi:hypothetical protein
MQPDRKSDFIIQSRRSKIEQNDKPLASIESEIEALLKQYSDIVKNYTLLISIKA